MFLKIDGTHYVAIKNVVGVFAFSSGNYKKQNDLIYLCEREKACSVAVVRENGKNIFYVMKTSPESVARRRLEGLKTSERQGNL